MQRLHAPQFAAALANSPLLCTALTARRHHQNAATAGDRTLVVSDDAGMGNAHARMLHAALLTGSAT